MSLFVDTSMWYAAADRSDASNSRAKAILAVMRRLGIERVAPLDDDFAIYRFGPNRRLAFTVVR
ncbi:MAG TPA: hypothetical protein VKV17_20970 [Bryobacteraceae bacterium]|nr:hypothetical protein [Bryobacteraceae bacterium]